MSARARVERFVFGEVARARPFLLARGLLAMLGLDCVIELVPHGGRYGIGDFNVAHFGVLDALQPTPSPAIYVGLMFACAMLALTQALAGPRRAGVLGLAALYTYAWAMSLLDAYQHHYLLSLLLVSVALFPRETIDDVVRAPARSAPVEVEGARPVVARAERRDRRAKKKPEPRATAPVPQKATTPRGRPPTTSAFGYVSFALTCTIVYFYTAVTKLEADFRTGAALARIVSPESLDVFRAAIGRPEMDPADAFRLLATGAIALQLVTAAGILYALGQDRRPGPRWLPPLLGLAPIAFHLGADAIELEIGWFSYYMLFVHVVLFAPALWLDAVARALRAVVQAVRELVGEVTPSRVAGTLAALLGLATVPLLHDLDLPGVKGAAIASGAVVTLVGAFAVLRARPTDAVRTTTAALVAACALRLAVTHGPVLGADASEVRYDFYRFVGGDSRRRGDYDAARDAYAKARAYAPDRAARARMESRLERIAREAP